LWKQVVVFFIVNQWGRLALLATILWGLWYWNSDYLIQSVYPDGRDRVLRVVGLGIYPLTLWALASLGVLLHKPNWFLRWWRWWLAAVITITAIQAALGAVHGPEGIVAEGTFGGEVGQWLWGSYIQGFSLVLGLTVLASVFLWPGPSYRAALATLRSMGRLALASLRALGQLVLRTAKATGRGMGKLALASLRALRQFVLRTAEATGRGMMMLARSSARTAWPGVKSIARPPRRQRPAPPENATAAVAQDLANPKVVETEQGDEEELPPQDIAFLEKDMDNLLEREPAKSTSISVINGKQGAPPTSIHKRNLPSVDFLEQAPSAMVTEEETQGVASKIEETLSNHGVQVTVDQIRPGPTVTLYGLSPGWIRRIREVKERDTEGNILKDSRGKPIVTRKEERTRVRVDSIVAREKDMALALAAPSLRIQAPVPGESVVGIEVPNQNPVLVSLRSVMESQQFQDVTSKDGFALGLGQGTGGESVVVDIRQLPHLLIAGSTGSGKSVCMNTLIVSLAAQASPERLRLLLIDPKRVELTPYNGLPHLVAPVVVDTEPAVRALKGMMREMFRRYRRLEKLKVRNIEGYHRHPNALEPMPYVVIAVDELADLMMSASYEVEQTLTRLAQLGRATGIHLIVATQRPSVDVVTGLIKANFPSRISFAVVSQVDSRTILDAVGAERLLGKGDMLFLSSDTPKQQRVQGAFVSDHEIGRLVDFWRMQEGPPTLQFDLEPEQGDRQDAAWDGEAGGGSRDEMLDKAVELASRYSHLSTSLLQRRLRIGYPRAARLMDQLEDEGVISPGEPGKSREVIKRQE
jgi:S-DNA-T family DNA segregation ATPase FtsK/SpoIIIE